MLIQSNIAHKTKGKGTFLVAASDAIDEVKQVADYVCDGVDDQVQINAAIQACIGNTATRRGGTVVLSEGRFTVSAPIQIDRCMHLSGQSAQVTSVYLADNSNCNMIEFKPGVDGRPVALNIIEHMKLHGNKNNNTGTVWGCWQDDDVNVAAIDVRFLDIWFESLSSGGISLVRYHNHQIQNCTFEHITGTAIQLRIVANSGLSESHIHHNFTLAVENFLSFTGSGGWVKKIVMTDNIISATKDVIEFPRQIFICKNNLISLPLAADNTYSVFKCNTDIWGGSVTMVDISGNIILCSSNGPKYLFHVYGAFHIGHLRFCDNTCQSYEYGWKTNGIRIATTNTGSNIQICRNNLRTPFAGNLIKIDRALNLVVADNILWAAFGSYELEANTNVLSAVVTGNIFYGGITGSWITGKYAPIIRNNKNWCTENAGAATITNGTTSVAVNHGLDETPGTGDIIVTPRESLGSATMFWVGSFTSTQFSIFVDQNPGKDLDFAWMARIHH